MPEMSPRDVGHDATFILQLDANEVTEASQTFFHAACNDRCVVPGGSRERYRIGIEPEVAGGGLSYGRFVEKP